MPKKAWGKKKNILNVKFNSLKESVFLGGIQILIVELSTQSREAGKDISKNS